MGLDRKPGLEEVRAPNEALVGVLEYLRGGEFGRREFDRYLTNLAMSYWGEARRLVGIARTYHLGLAVPRFPPEGLRASPFTSLGEAITRFSAQQPPDLVHEQVRQILLHQERVRDEGQELPPEETGVTYYEPDLEGQVSDHVLLPVAFFYDGLRRLALGAGLALPWVDQNREVYFRCPLCLRSDPTNRRYGQFHCRQCMRQPISEADLAVAWNVALDAGLPLRG